MPESTLRDSFHSETSFDLFGPVGPESGKTAEEIAAFNWKSVTNGPGRTRREPREGRATQVLAIFQAEGRRLPCDIRD